MRESGVRDPDLFEALALDPTLPREGESQEVLLRDLQRPSRRYVKPWLRVLCLVQVWIIVFVKRLLPFQISWHGGIDLLMVWFTKRFVSADAGWQLIRHTLVETKLINFVIRNSGANDIDDCTLLPTTIDDLGGGAIMDHDRNIYNLVIDLGRSTSADVQSHLDPARLDFSMLDLPEIDASRTRRRWLNLDIETALCVMSVPFSLFTTEREYERAVNSFQLDESLLACIANLTGDCVYRTWTPLKFPVWLSIRRDVPRDLFWHAVVNEYAFARLCDMRAVVARGDPWPPTRGD